MGSLVLLEEREGVAIVRLNRPDKRNAMDRASRIALIGVFQTIRDRFPVVILTGSGESFCAGVDLKEHKQDIDRGIPPDPSSDWIDVILAVREHPAVFIAAVNGLALGGGSTLISVCDLAIAADEAEIGMPEIGFGAYPQFSGPGAQMQLTTKRAAWLVLTAERINGRTAQEWGMVNTSVPRAELMEVAERLAAKISRFDPLALSEAKRALDTVPAKISVWRQAFEYGLDVNARIRERGKVQSDTLSGFAASQRRGGLGAQS
jgi:enoyl-CoA hydratase/carnithine racemase